MAIVLLNELNWLMKMSYSFLQFFNELISFGSENNVALWTFFIVVTLS